MLNWSMIIDYCFVGRNHISQLSWENFNQMINMISELFIDDPETI
jgi:hypothetical protein